MIKLDRKLIAIPLLVIGTVGVLEKLLKGDMTRTLVGSLFIIAGVLILLEEKFTLASRIGVIFKRMNRAILIKPLRDVRVILPMVLGTAGVLVNLIVEGDVTGALWYSLFIIAGVIALLHKIFTPGW
ncbi:MAG: hypothetical protein QXI22_03730 [Sulfolobales archaeon]